MIKLPAFTRAAGAASSRPLLVIAGHLLVLLILVHFGATSAITGHIDLPMLTRLRSQWGTPPEISDRLKVYSLDDSTYAMIGRPYLSGSDWARIYSQLAAAKPAAIVTSHMFGTGEFREGLDELADALGQARDAGIRTTAALFAYPGEIRYRERLVTDRPEFKDHPRGVPGTDLGGWFLYGPTEPYSVLFTSLGHTSYNGSDGFPPYLRIDTHAAVPHLALSATGLERIFDDKAMDQAARPPAVAHDMLRMNFPQPEALTRAARSLKSLLQDDAAAYVSRNVRPGDTVLILSEMYSGKASFVRTPAGMMPAGYVTAVALNMALSRAWIHDYSDHLLPVLVAIGLGTLAGMLAGWIPLVLAAAFMIPGWVACSLWLFAAHSILVPVVIPVLMFCNPLAVTATLRLRKRLREEQQGHLLASHDKARLSAIVRTAQMFAHDVRKPFSMLNMAAQALKRERDPGSVSRLLASLLPELDRAMSSVEGMIQDIMDIENDAVLTPERYAVRSLITECLAEIFRLHPETDIRLSYDFHHTMQVHVDQRRIRRVLLNILENAVQAMNGKGDITIRTKDFVGDFSENLTGGSAGESNRDPGRRDTSFIEIAINNSGPPIPVEDQTRVFEAFFTRSKKNGTGLGLAIARKIINQHGGGIRCHSSSEAGTTFTFTLPVNHDTPQLAETSAGLPATSQGFADGEPTNQAPVVAQADLQLEFALQASLLRFSGEWRRNFRILIVDDESPYIDGTTSILRGETREAIIDVRSCRSGEEAITLMANWEPDFVLCDIDLGQNRMNGFDLVSNLRSRGFGGYILMHSNRVVPMAAFRSKPGGANGFLSKPATPEQLFPEIITGVESRLNGPRPLQAAPESGQTIVVIDDNPFTLEAWGMVAGPSMVVPFACPAEFWKALAADPALLDKIACIVTDYHFDNEPATTGISFAARLKQSRNIPVFLSTDARLEEVPANIIDAVIPKEATGLQDLVGRLKKPG